MMWPTRSVPALVDNANWNGEQTDSTVLANCRAGHLATSLLKAMPVAIPLTPHLVSAMLSWWPPSTLGPPWVELYLWRNLRWQRTTTGTTRDRPSTRGGISFVHPPGPGEQPDARTPSNPTAEDSRVGNP